MQRSDVFYTTNSYKIRRTRAINRAFSIAWAIIVLLNIIGIGLFVAFYLNLVKY